MAIDISKYLSAEQRKAIIDNRLQQFAVEAYQHSVNLAVAQAVEDEQAIESAEKALAILETAIAAHEDELATLGK